MIDLVRPSPHFNERPKDVSVDLIVIHNISLPPNFYEGPWIDDLFLGRLNAAAHPYFEEVAKMRVSSHLLIRRSGQCIQYVPFDKRAWHAGESVWQGRSNCNDFSIGIELEGSDFEPFNEVQYQVLGREIKNLFRIYPALNEQTICGHLDIAPDRKTDPGPFFDWQCISALIR